MAYYIGLISGTSMDAIDAALVSIETAGLQILCHREFPYPSDLHAKLEAVVAPDALVAASTIGALHTSVGIAFASAASALLAEAGVRTEEVAAIGSHGQTIAHGPEGDPPFTVQLGDPSTIAYRTGITTVADFRSMDIAAGGQGAPLVALFHAFHFDHANETIVVVNIGGMANITILPAGPAAQVIAFDTGPGNTLLDQWCRRHLGKACDYDGAWATSGKVDESLLGRLRSDPYFDRSYPKTTGRGYFNLAWIERRRAGMDSAAVAPADVQATLLALTARSVADAIQRESPDCARVLVCGGGAKNTALMTALRACLPIPIASTANVGTPPEAVEAAAFAWLAAERLAGRTGNSPAATGALMPAILGGIFEPPGRGARG